jgi:hypothetical protein
VPALNTVRKANTTAAVLRYNLSIGLNGNVLAAINANAGEGGLNDDQQRNARAPDEEEMFLLSDRL